MRWAFTFIGWSERIGKKTGRSYHDAPSHRREYFVRRFCPPGRGSASSGGRGRGLDPFRCHGYPLCAESDCRPDGLRSAAQIFRVTARRAFNGASSGSNRHRICQGRCAYHQFSSGSAEQTARGARAYRCLYPAHRPGNSPRNRWRGQRGQYRRHRDRRRRYFCCGFSNFQAARLSRRDSGDAQRARGLRRERSMTEMTPHLSCLAPAKLNLFLHITGRRPDGYHTLQTVFQLLDYGDTLHFRVRDDAVIRRATASLEVPEENDLAIRAARLLQTQSRCPLGVEIGIDKRVPIGAGLGGGSSDAACVLLALNRLWRLNLPRVQLQRLALSLGADVPFFVFGRNAFAEGIGERLHAIDLPNRYFLIVTP